MDEGFTLRVPQSRRGLVLPILLAIVSLMVAGVGIAEMTYIRSLEQANQVNQTTIFDLLNKLAQYEPVSIVPQPLAGGGGV